MEENKRTAQEILHKYSDGNISDKLWLLIIKAMEEYANQFKVTPPESLKELEERVKKLWEEDISWNLQFNRGYKLSLAQSWKIAEPLISSMLQGKDEEHKMLGNYDSGYSAAEYGIIKFINEWNHGETNSHMGQILEDKFGSQISSLQAQLQSKEDSLTHWRNEGYHAREELYKAKERIKQLEAEAQRYWDENIKLRQGWLDKEENQPE